MNGGNASPSESAANPVSIRQQTKETIARKRISLALRAATAPKALGPKAHWRVAVAERNGKWLAVAGSPRVVVYRHCSTAHCAEGTRGTVGTVGVGVNQLVESVKQTIGLAVAHLHQQSLRVEYGD